MKSSEIWAVEHTFAWKSDLGRSHEVAVAIFESEDLAREWLRGHAAHVGSNGEEVALAPDEGELYYETKYALNKFELVLLPFYRKGGDA